MATVQPPISTADRPFALPNRELICTVIDLPMPPSVNRIWRQNKAGAGLSRVSRSQEYRDWIKAADDLTLSLAALRGVKMIRGRFTALITLKFNAASDIDNRIKGVLDWAQSRHLILNDRNCQELTIRWGDAPHGCRLKLTELV